MTGHRSVDDSIIHRQLHPSIKMFLREMAGDLQFAALHDIWEKAFRTVDIAADVNRDACRFMQTVEWVCGRPHSVGERLEALKKLAELH